MMVRRPGGGKMFNALVLLRTVFFCSYIINTALIKDDVGLDEEPCHFEDDVAADDVGGEHPPADGAFHEVPLHLCLLMRTWGTTPTSCHALSPSREHCT
mmetsp:Transcript_89803/g.290150  ORF Transcript_89803/g.290150 Transcript_89803/m.290150 type:complete len:99 (+) Transcript_89803:100-396(+)